MAERKRGPKPKDRAPTPLRGVPMPPGHLPPAAKRQWLAVAGLIDEAGRLSSLDVFALEQYCSLYARWREAQKKVDEDGAVITLPNHFLQMNPWQQVAVQCQRDMLRYLVQFGLTPAARAKLSLPEDEADDPKWAGFEAG